MATKTPSRPAQEGLGAFETKRMRINVGPQHPSTHGVLRLVVDLEGERIVSLRPHVGYLHTGFEKTMENRTYQQCVTYSNRMDYVNGFAHDLAYVLAVEKLMDARVPVRAQRIRVILVELNRIASHLVFFGTTLLDMGALTPFFYCMREREKILDIFEAVCGVRMNYGYFRVGGLRQDVPEGFGTMVRDFVRDFPQYLDQYKDLFMGNDILLARTRGVGVLTKQQAIDYCLTGPSLRASGVPLDFRKAAPYSGYQDYDFDVPCYDDGDIWARMQVRMDEMHESLKIVQQAIDMLEPGPTVDPDRRISLPPRSELESSMEAVIFHFKLVTEGFRVPVGQAWQTVEHPRGELGVHLVSDGGTRPYRAHFRDPSFNNLQAVAAMCEGGQVADVVVAVASLDPVLGGVDR